MHASQSGELDRLDPAARGTQVNKEAEVRTAVPTLETYKRVALLVAVMLLAIPAASAADLPGWEAARWGMTAEEIEQAFAGKAIHLGGRLDYHEAYAELGVPEVELGGLDFALYFQMSTATDRLQQVLLEHRKTASAEATAAVREALERRFGPPTALCRDRNGQRSYRWRFPTTTLHLSAFDLRGSNLIYEDPNSDRDILQRQSERRRINPRFLARRIVVRAHATERQDLAPGACEATR